MHFRKYRIFLTAVIVLVIIASIFALNINSKSMSADKNILQKDKAIYYLKEYNGKIGIFNTGEDSPFEIIDVYISTLPFLDQQNLKEGIPIYNYNELTKAKEDFGS